LANRRSSGSPRRTKKGHIIGCRPPNLARWRKRNELNQVSRRESENRVNLNRWSSGVVALQDLALSFVKDNNGDLLSEDNGFFDEAFGNEWEIVR
jgi:hypothetical protein